MKKPKKYDQFHFQAFLKDGMFGKLLIFLTFLIFLSSCGVNRRISRADKRFEAGEYHAAGEIYRSVYGRVSAQRNQPLKAQIAFRQGVSHQRINHNRTAFAFQNAIRHNYPDSIVFLYLAQALQRDGRHADAARNFEIFLEYDPENIVAQNGLFSSQMIAEWRQTPTRYTVRQSRDFNVRRNSNFSPAFVGNSTDMMILTSTRSVDRRARTRNNPITGMGNSNMFSVRKNAAGKWESPEILPAEINKPNSENGVAAFSPDGRTMYFTRGERSADSDMGAQIMVSQRAGGAWSEPRPLQIFQDSTITVAHPTISPDGEMIYFVSDAPDGFGGKDIWRARLADGGVRYIENLGPEINTSGDEMFPMMRHDGILFFSSNGHPGFGGLDIFRATPIPDEENEYKTRWVVENMGVPINSRWDDFGITFAGQTESGYFSSNRNERQGFDMIWSFYLPELTYFIEGRVFDDRNEIIGEAIVRMVGNDGTNARIQARRDGSYRLRLNPDVDYVMMASARGHLNQSHALNTQGLTDSKTFNFDFNLTPAFRPVALENIFYEFGRWDLRPDSEAGLQALLKLLNDNPNITIELSAHTDFVGSRAANQLLSERRAQSVVNYLVANGISRTRLTSVGHGAERPVVVSTDLAKKHDFLTEGDVLTEDFIVNSLTTEQREIANQINRRTEFRVLRTTYNLQ